MRLDRVAGWGRLQGLMMRICLILIVVLAGVGSSRAAEGMLVRAGTPRPEQGGLEVEPAHPTTLDLLLEEPLPADNQCRVTLFAVGGPLATPIWQKVERLDCVADTPTGFRVPVSLEVPAARPGARFWLKVECLAPKSRELGRIQLFVPDSHVDAGNVVVKRPVVLLGIVPELARVLGQLGIAFTEGGEVPDDAIVFAGPAAGLPDAATSFAVVEFVSPAHPAQVLTLTARAENDVWKVQVVRPKAHDLTGAAGRNDLIQLFQFITQLEPIANAP